MLDDDPFGFIFDQSNWPSDIAFWLFNGATKIPIGCDVCGQPLRYRPGGRPTDEWHERYYCPTCGWPDEKIYDIVTVPAVFLAWDEESEAGGK